MSEFRLLAKIFVRASIVARTGLRIGGSGGVFTIGGVDNAAISNPLTRQPYIPGSSLRGKMRSLVERAEGKVTGQKISDVMIHACTSEEEYHICPICNIFGITARDWNYPTRLIVRDVFLTPESKIQLEKANTALEFTEVKTEVAIDRVTSQATPRQIERVPAGAVFGPMELVFNLYSKGDALWLPTVFDGLALLEDDYLGSYGSRGYGQIAFSDIVVSYKTSDAYAELKQWEAFPALSDLLAQRDAIRDHFYRLF